MEPITGKFLVGLVYRSAKPSPRELDRASKRERERLERIFKRKPMLEAAFELLSRLKKEDRELVYNDLRLLLTVFKDIDIEIEARKIFASIESSNL